MKISKPHGTRKKPSLNLSLSASGDRHPHPPPERYRPTPFPQGGSILIQPAAQVSPPDLDTSPSISRSWRRCATVPTPWLFLTANPVQTLACQEVAPDLLFAHLFSPFCSYVCTTMIAILLLQYLRNKAKYDWYMSNLVTFIRIHLMSYIDLWSWMNQQVDKAHSPPDFAPI